MTDDARPTDRHRQAHTVYLTGEVWHALSRRHLELRLQGTAPDSKIEFIEQVLRVGLEAVGQKATLSSIEAGMGIAAGEADRQPRPGSTDRTAAREGGADKPPSQLRSASQRSKVMDRLLQASDPGRPAPIHSAADDASSD